MKKLLSKLIITSCFVVGFSNQTSALTTGEEAMIENPFGEGKAIMVADLTRVEEAGSKIITSQGTKYVVHGDDFMAPVKKGEKQEKEVVSIFKYEDRVYMRAQDLAKLLEAEVTINSGKIIFKKDNKMFEISLIDENKDKREVKVKTLTESNEIDEIIDNYEVTIWGYHFGDMDKYVPVRLVSEKLGLNVGWISWNYSPNEALFVYEKETAK